MSGVTVTTPSGHGIYFQSEPKRLYRVFDPALPMGEWVEVPSVTRIFDCLSKDGLTWWGMKIGIQGVFELAKLNILVPADFESDYLKSDAPDKWADNIDYVCQKLTEHKLTVNHQRDKAADRGSRVHDALETWAATGQLSNPDDFDESERGYVVGLNAFLTEARIEPIAHEVMVGSSRYGFAGRFDLRARITQESTVVGKLYPKKAPKMTTVPAGEGIFDLKTSKGVYVTHHLQLEAYEGASVENGYEPTDWRAILHVTSDGRYELVRSKARFDHFLAVKAAHDAIEEVEEARKL